MRPAPLLSVGVVSVAGAVLAVAGAVAFLALYRKHRHRERAIERSRPVEATVEAVRGLDENQGWVNSYYRPDLTYSYEFEGDGYESTNVFPGGLQWEHDREEMAELVEALADQRTVTVYVDPTTPREAYLVEGSERLYGVGVVLSGLLALFGLGLLIAGFL